MLRRIPPQSLYGTSSTLCRRCFLQCIATRRPQTRHISTSYLKKQAENEKEWAERAELIKEGKVQHLWDLFKERGYIKDIAGTENQIRELMRVKRIGAYVGIDPTAPSLHVGHLLPLMPLFWMYIHGYRAVSLIGGTTARIGDPTGRLKGRDPMAPSEAGKNITKTHYQLKLIWTNLEVRAWSRALCNNTITTRLFRGVRVSTLLSRDVVKNRLENGDGMSLDELIYPMMQAWDFWQLFKQLGVRMQIGGSDQYGNIVTGVECVKYVRDTETDASLKLPNDLINTPVGFTTPLLTDSAGNKFGKSAGNAVWLDPFMTSPFDLYGYWVRQPDHDVERLLKFFTFIPTDEITKIVEEHKKDPPKRVAQHKLAFEVLSLVHSHAQAKEAENQHRGIFSTKSTELTQYPAKEMPAGIDISARFKKDIELPESLILGKSISRILFAAGLADSVTDAHRLVKQQGAYIGGRPGRHPDPKLRQMETGDLTFTPVKNWFVQETRNFLIDGKILVLRRGKHFVRIVEMISDEEWAKTGLMYPGEPGTGRIRQLRDLIKKNIDSQGVKIDRDMVETLAARAGDIYGAQGIKLWPSNRAKQILQRSLEPYLHEGPASVHSKTNLIDKVFEEAMNDPYDDVSDEDFEDHKEVKPKNARTDVNIKKVMQ
ncbi:hypothetical protein F4806DRAFT_487414 [Annulohypoxylon nitens]|nr:hypothetical protein F4806DRAFT_487414 [Annulohypoxylon nitens]